MTSENVIVSIKLCPEVGNGESIVVCNFGGHRMRGFEVLEGDLVAPSSRSQEAKKTGRNRVKDRGESLTKYVQETFERLLYELLEARHSCKTGFLAFILMYQW